MRIQHNIMAMNAYRNYTNNTSALSSNLEKLRSEEHTSEPSHSGESRMPSSA